MMTILKLFGLLRILSTVIIFIFSNIQNYKFIFSFPHLKKKFFVIVITFILFNFCHINFYICLLHIFSYNKQTRQCWLFECLGYYLNILFSLIFKLVTLLKIVTSKFVILVFVRNLFILVNKITIFIL